MALVVAPLARPSRSWSIDPMRSDITQGATFPDFQLTGTDKQRHKLSELQGNDPLVPYAIRMLTAINKLDKQSDRKAEKRVEESEGHPLEDPELEIAERQVALDRLGQHRKNRAICKVEYGDQERHSDEQAPVAV